MLLLTPEAYLPLRAVGAQFHASTEGAAAPRRRLRDPRHPGTRPGGQDSGARPADLRRDTIRLTGVGLSYPGRDRDAADRT